MAGRRTLLLMELRPADIFPFEEGRNPTSRLARHGRAIRSNNVSTRWYPRRVTLCHKIRSSPTPVPPWHTPRRTFQVEEVRTPSKIAFDK